MSERERQYRASACAEMHFQVGEWEDEACNEFLNSEDEHLYPIERLQGFSLEYKQNLIKKIEFNRIHDAPIAEVEAEYGDEIHKTQVTNKVIQAYHTGKLNLEKGSRNWFKLYLDITPLTWERNFSDGYQVEVYEFDSNGRKQHLDTVKL